MFGLGMTHILLLLVLGVLLFGKRLPEVARTVGKMMMEFKRGWGNIEDHISNGTFPGETTRAEPPPPPPLKPPQRMPPTGQKFEDDPNPPPPPPSSPIV